MVTHTPQLSVGGYSASRQSDRRDSYRFDVRGAARLQLRALELPVADLSASGMALHLPRHYLRSLDPGRALFQLGEDSVFEASFDTVSTRIAGTDQFRVGTRFRHLSRPALQKLSEFLLGELMSRSRLSAARPVATESALVSEDRAFVAALLRFHGITLRRPLRAYFCDLALSNQLAITEVVEGDRIQIASLSPLPVGFIPGTELSFLLSTAGSAVCFRTLVRFAETHRAELAFPERIVRSGFRDSFRAIVDGVDVEIRFQHPRLPVTVRKRALDVSARGVSFPLDVHRDILFPGDHLTPMQIMLPGGPVRATAIVRSVRELAGGGMGCGVELLELSDSRSWAEAVFRSGHPNTLLSEDGAPEGAWRAMDTSGYVSLWTHPKTLASAKQEFQRVWRAMPESHGHLLVVKRDRVAVGTIAANRLYRRTWMMHLLGVDKGARQIDDRASFYRITRELYSGLAFMLQHLTDLKYLVVYFATDSRWNDALHVAFEREYPVGSHLASSQYAIYRTSEEVTDDVASVEESGYRVRALGAPDLDEVASALAQRFTPQECEAYDYQRDLLLNDDFSQECRSAGYERSRKNFVIENEQNGIIGILMMETGAESANLFNLLNTCRFIPLRAVGRDAGLVRLAGLEYATRYYAQSGKRSHLVFDYSLGKSAPCEHTGYRHLCDGVAWMMHRDVLPPWLSFVDDLLGIKSSSRRRSGD